MTGDKRNIELLTKFAEKQGMSLEELGARIVNDNELGRRTPEEIDALFKKPKEEATLEGWVARDKGGGLYLHWIRPYRGMCEWHSLYFNPRQLDPKSFPEVTWESEPLKVKLTITPME